MHGDGERQGEQLSRAHQQREKHIEGRGIGMGLALLGLALVVVPFLTDFSRVVDSVLLISAVIVLGLGIGMALDDLSSLRDRPSLKDFAPTVALAGLSVATVVIWRATSADGWFLVLLVVLLVFFATFTCVGFGIGLSKAFAEMDDIAGVAGRLQGSGRGQKAW
ncbi:MAG TPA: hypothetical protein VGR21_11210, partial [Cryptosporangiaceae bacterium]|nr:hypothetical protein [Cryptosporangiaceae bacterium]